MNKSQKIYRFLMLLMALGIIIEAAWFLTTDFSSQNALELIVIKILLPLIYIYIGFIILHKVIFYKHKQNKLPEN